MAIVDIGSNSVRLVSYESRSRAPTPTFNEKALCGLGRGVAMTGLLHEDAIAKALAALQRFRVLCGTMRIRDVRGIATAAVRDAANGAEFLNRAERVLGCKIELLSGQREARLSALGVVSSIYKADGVVGDLGGGSLELTDVRDGECAPGVTLPSGGLSLMDLSERSPKKAAKIVRETLATVKALQGLTGRTFYAVGGTWRALARLHMRQRQYPMNVMHNYVIPSRDALEFAGWSNGSRRTRCCRSSWSRRLAGRSWLTAPRCWRRSSARPVRRRSSFPLLAFARGCIYSRLHS